MIGSWKGQDYFPGDIPEDMAMARWLEWLQMQFEPYCLYCRRIDEEDEEDEETPVREADLVKLLAAILQDMREMGGLQLQACP